MKRKMIEIGILAGALALCAGCGPAPLGVAGGYVGWRNEGTNGQDAKLTAELSVQSTDPLINGLWINYVNYDNTNNGQNVKSISTYVDHTAPFAIFTTDGARTQHFTDHVGVLVAQATDTNHDGIICWIGCGLEAGSPGAGDYALQNAICPTFGGTASANGSGFKAYCNRATWPGFFVSGTPYAEETKSGVGKGIPYASPEYLVVLSPTQLAQLISTSQALENSLGIAPTVTGVLLPNGDAHVLSTAITVNTYLQGGVSINADQPGLKELASWLADEWISEPDGETKVAVTFNGSVTGNFTLASGHAVAQALQIYASR